MWTNITCGHKTLKIPKLDLITKMRSEYKYRPEYLFYTFEY